MKNALSEDIVIHADAQSFKPFDWPARWVWVVDKGEIEADRDHPPDFTPEGHWEYRPSGREESERQFQLILKIVGDTL